MKNKSAKILSLLLALSLMLSVLSACGKQPEEPIEDTTESTTEPTTQKVKTDYNRLTGLDDLSKKAKGKRPIAIMINNLKGSLPQYGIYDADLMFECIVEGGITRMMAVYADYTKIPDVCSVRSCRYYFPVFAQGLDAVYFCFGCNPTLGKTALKNTGIDYFDGSENYDTLVFGRDPNRIGRYSKEHTAYVKGASIPAMLEKYSVRSDYKKEKDDYIFKFRNPKKLNGDACETVRLNFSNQYYSTFTYDAENKVYLKQHSGKAHMDSAAQKQLGYTNVFVLETEVGLYQNGPLMQMNWKGGTGYYISYGTVIPIKWSKKNYDETIVVKDLKGKEIKVNKGNSYIGVINYNSTVFPKQ